MGKCSEKKDLYYNEVKIVLAGTNHIGKESFIRRFVWEAYHEDYDCGIEDTYRKQTKLFDTNLVLSDWGFVDINMEYKALLDNYVRKADFIVLCIKLSDSLYESELVAFVERVKSLFDLEPNVLPFALVGLQCDDVNKRKVSKNEAMKLAKKLKMKYFETSAKDNINVKESCFEFIKMALKYQMYKEQLKLKRADVAKPNCSVM